jgi:hypothetical protein
VIEGTLGRFHCRIKLQLFFLDFGFRKFLLVVTLAAATYCGYGLMARSLGFLPLRFRSGLYTTTSP